MSGNFGIFSSVESPHILRVIFSLLLDNTKLSFISYNKQIQKKLFVNIENYKKICERQIVEGNDGRMKEYKINTNILVFEGEYKNRKRNGKGNEYYENTMLKFDGIYSNGKKISGKGYDFEGNYVLILENGKGKEFYDNNNLQFEGEYLNGKRWNGKGYDYNGDEEFEMKYRK